MLYLISYNIINTDEYKKVVGVRCIRLGSGYKSLNDAKKECSSYEECIGVADYSCTSESQGKNYFTCNNTI